MRTLSIFFFIFLLVPMTPTMAEVDTQYSPVSKRVLLSVDDTWFHRLGLNRFTYKRALRKVGLEPVTVNFRSLNDEIPDAVLAERLLEGMHGLVLAGGGDVDPVLFGQKKEFSLGVNADRDRFELALLHAAEAQGMPVFAICRGAQLLNVARGGTLLNLRADTELAPVHKRRWGGHGILLSEDSRLSRWLGATEIPQVSTFHGQAIDRLGEGLRIVGHAPDGTVEAIESTLEIQPEGVFGTVGVQWHPEVRTGAQQLKIFRAFADAVRSPVIVPATDVPAETAEGAQ